MRYVAFLLFLSGCGAAPCGGPHVGQWASTDVSLTLSDACRVELEDDLCQVIGTYIITDTSLQLDVEGLIGTCLNWQLGKSKSVPYTLTDTTLTWAGTTFTRR